MNSESLLVVGLGEALFDLFEDRTVLGGAPLNVAFHAGELLRTHGGESAVVTAVGADPEGESIQRSIARWSRSSVVQIDPEHPTGKVLVRRTAHDVAYEIVRKVAWDYLRDSEEISALSQKCHAVSFGSLAQRSPVSQATILKFVDSANQAIRLFDVNLRQNFFDQEVLHRSCSRSTVVKCNREELPILEGLMLDIPDRSGSEPERAERLRQRFNLDAWILTRGREGTVAITREGVFDAAPVHYPPAPGADPVGAGDGCTAAILVGMLLKQPWPEIVQNANDLGAWIASQPGATPSRRGTVAS